MTRRAPDFKHLPAPLQRLGAELAELEQVEDRVLPGARRWRPVSMSVAGALLAVLVAVLIVLDSGGRARASIINRAPAAAAASKSVRFRSTISIARGSRQLSTFTQQGEVDFGRRSFATSVQLGSSGAVIQQRRLGGVLYVAQTEPGGTSSSPVRWIAIPVAHESSNSFAADPEREEFTDPLALLDELTGTRAPVRTLGPARVDGVATTRYGLRTNLAALLSTAPDAGRQPASFAAVPVDLKVWLDRVGRPRRIVETVAGRSPSGPVAVKTTVDFSAYGQPVRIAVPSHVKLRSKHSIVSPSPLSASPSRLFERLLRAPNVQSCSQAGQSNCRRVPNP